MTLIESFGLFIETAGPSHAAEQLRVQVGEVAVEMARTTWSGKVLTQGTNRLEIEAALGKPEYSDLHQIGYVLPHRVGYLYTFEFEPVQHLLIQSGYRRINSVELSIAIPTNAFEGGDFSQQLATAGATLSEVEMLLGKPIDHYGWWPMETWEYPHTVITFCNGIVVNDEAG